MEVTLITETFAIAVIFIIGCPLKYFLAALAFVLLK